MPFGKNDDGVLKHAASKRRERAELHLVPLEKFVL